MDPQQRILLEVTYEAFDSDDYSILYLVLVSCLRPLTLAAGITTESLKNSDTSVWCGSFVRGRLTGGADQ